ncbi:hypothetical protein BGZ81_007200 [Podila clonocystis]|nr:hypothetical protein BGZ81_007200 [Podila clonocystis]
MAKASFTTFLLLATLALIAAVAAQTPATPSTPVVTSTTSTGSPASGTVTPTTKPSGPPPAFTNSIDFSSLANVISNYASAKPPAATGTAGAKGSAGNAVGPHMGAAAVVLAAVVVMF